MERSVIAIDGLAALRERMERLELEAAARRALLGAGEQLARDVRANLSTPPGGPHAVPWLRSGALRDSIAMQEVEDGVVVFSGSDVAIHQELGTRHVPPRPFLAPAAVSAIDDVAGRVAAGIQAEAQHGGEVA